MNRSVIGVTVYSVSLECKALGSELHGQHLIPSRHDLRPLGTLPESAFHPAPSLVSQF